MENGGTGRHSDVIAKAGPRTGSGGKREVQVGKIVETVPRFGRLDAYAKKDGQMGACVLSEADGAKYGVSKGVLDRFTEVGSYPGWAYIDAERDVAFRFIVGSVEERLEPLLFIDGPEGRVGIPARHNHNGALRHGVLVAFYAYLAGPKRQATDIFPIDGQHLPLLIRLIANGALSFPQHAEVVPVLMDSLRRGDAAHSQDQAKLFVALDRLSSDPGVDPEYQRLARVEGGRLRSSPSQRISPRPVSSPHAFNKSCRPSSPEGPAQTEQRDPGEGDIDTRDLLIN